uniref:Uncharacterized protein n=1 Tax=Anguilla anguilla TaxID=7936 RepID=A0A0E9W8Z9_ANGAN
MKLRGEYQNYPERHQAMAVSARPYSQIESQSFMFFGERNAFINSLRSISIFFF